MRIEREHEERNTELMLKSKEQLRSVREQFDVERAGLASQIELLRSSKIELQAEIGQLLRDRRTQRSFGIDVQKFSR